MRTWIPSQVYRDEVHAAEELRLLIAHYESGGNPREVQVVLGVELKASGELVGHVGLSPFEDGVEIGYAIERAYQRRGLASEASKAMCRWAMTEYSIGTILGVTARDNVASQQVLLRTGFVRKEERVMKLQGDEQPAVIYELRGDSVDKIDLL